MGKKVPTCGYPSRTEAIIALRAQGMTRRQIAQTAGISETTISSFLNCRDKRHRKVMMPPEVVAPLQREALKRGQSVADLANRLLATIARDRLVAAILDDEAPEEASR